MRQVINKLTFFVGLPRSGKSTFAKQWLQVPDDDGLPKAIVNQDNIRLALTGERYNSHCEGLVKEFTNLMIKTYLTSGYHVLYDETNTSIDSIKNVYSLCENAEPLFIWTSPQVCKERALDTNQPDLCKAIDRMSRNLRLLWHRYCKFDIHEFTYNVSHLDIWNGIYDAIKNSVEPYQKHIIL